MTVPHVDRPQDSDAVMRLEFDEVAFTAALERAREGERPRLTISLPRRALKVSMTLNPAGTYFWLTADIGDEKRHIVGLQILASEVCELADAEAEEAT